MHRVPQQILAGLEANVESVKGLMGFDEVVLSTCIQQVSAANDRIKEQWPRHTRFHLDKTLKLLTDIRDHKSLRSDYRAIYKQCVVLLVSHFSSAMQDLFERCLGLALCAADLSKAKTLNEKKLQLTIRQVVSLVAGRPEEIGEAVVAQEKMSFQDMQSISREFRTYFGCEIERDANVDNTILGQACRHAIVHTGGKVDGKLLSQISGATQRTVKPVLQLGEDLEFSPDEIDALAESMLGYARSVAAQLQLAERSAQTD